MVVVIIEVYSAGVSALYHAVDNTTWRAAVYGVAFLVCKVRFHCFLNKCAVVSGCLDNVSWQVGGDRLIRRMLVGRPGVSLVLADALLFTFELCMSVQVNLSAEAKF